ncbi:MAG: PCRF domain-containing protein, partial [Bifidobacteriaceae bacterium]|nr:PCRF domain-containing protein [Bifidobacteriaceae bacterium]
MATEDIQAELRALNRTFDSISQVSAPDEIQARIGRLSDEASEPGLWDNPDRAQIVTSRLSHAQGELEKLDAMRSRLDDLAVLFQMGEEAEDADTLEEAHQELAAVQASLAEMEIRTLLNGEYDQRFAVVTIRSGAGGVDAADFAEMLLRMYLRWAERHGYPVKILDTFYAEEAGLKSVTFEVSAPYAYGNLSVEGGTHRLVRISPFDNQGRRHTSFAAVEVIPLIEDTDHIEIPETDIKVDVFRSSGP